VNNRLAAAVQHHFEPAHGKLVALPYCDIVAGGEPAGFGVHYLALGGHHVPREQFPRRDRVYPCHFQDPDGRLLRPAHAPDGGRIHAFQRESEAIESVESEAGWKSGAVAHMAGTALDYQLVHAIAEVVASIDRVVAAVESVVRQSLRSERTVVPELGIPAGYSDESACLGAIHATGNPGYCDYAGADLGCADFPRNYRDPEMTHHCAQTEVAAAAEQTAFELCALEHLSAAGRLFAGVDVGPLAMVVNDRLGANTALVVFCIAAVVPGVVDSHDVAVRIPLDLNEFAAHFVAELGHRPQ